MNSFNQEVGSAINALGMFAQQQRAQRQAAAIRAEDIAREDTQNSFKNKIAVLDAMSKAPNIDPKFKAEIQKAQLSLLSDPNTPININPVAAASPTLVPDQVKKFFPGIANWENLSPEQQKIAVSVYDTMTKNTANLADKADLKADRQEKRGMERERLGIEQKRADAYIKKAGADTQTAENKGEKDTLANQIKSLGALQTGLLNKRKQLTDQAVLAKGDEKEGIKGQIRAIDKQLSAIEQVQAQGAGVEFEPEEVSQVREQMAEILNNIKGMTK